MIITSLPIKKEIEIFCKKIGKDPLLVQGAGGNVSWKENDTLWIKASGKWIINAASENFFVPIKLGILEKSIKKNDFSIKPQVIDQSGLRPSIETFLHALLPHKIVLHIHAVEILAHLVQVDAEKKINDILSGNSNWIYLDYYKPGAELAMALAKKINNKNNVDLIFMANHGIVIGGENTENILNLLRDLTLKFRTKPQLNFTKHQKTKTNSKFFIRGYSRCANKEINSLVTEKKLVYRLKYGWALYPDHVVFLGANPAILETNFAKVDLVALSKLNPPFIFVIDDGVYENNDVQPYQHDQLRCYYDVIVRLKKSSKLRVLKPEEISDLLNWDAETYRKNLQ